MDHSRSGTNGWNERDYDDSSNSNSLDGACMDDNVMSTLKEKSNKSIKNEPDMDVSENAPTSRRKRNRALKAIVNDDAIQSDDEKSLNICWNADDTIKIKEETISPVDDAHISDSGSNNTGDVDTQAKATKSTKDVNLAKEEKRTRSAASEPIKPIESKAKLKLTSSHCKYCFKKFSNASNLRRHITMSHFGPQKFTCNLCMFNARRKIDMLSHVRTKHQLGGERADALKYVTIHEEPVAKPPQSSSANRRKEKHTEVLRDDEEEIFIDSEAFIVEENTEPLQALCASNESNENSNADLGDGSNNQVDESADQTDSTRSDANSKRKGRPKAKDKMKTAGRSQSPGDQQMSNSLPARRPIRNRIMPVKKDFVYDLSTLLKKDYKDFHDEIQKQSLSPPGQPQSQATQVAGDKIKSRNASPTPIDNKTNKRRTTLPNTLDTSEIEPEAEPESVPVPVPEPETQIEQQKEELPKLPPQSQSNPKNDSSPSEADVIKGAADVMAQQAVLSNRAAASKPPELPAERPVATPQRQFDSKVMKDWPILKRPPAIFDGVKSKLSSLKVPGLKRKKRSCLLKHSINTNHKNRLHDKHKTATNGHTTNNSRYKCIDSDPPIQEKIKISSQLANKIQLKCAQIDSDKGKTATKPEVQVQQSVASSNLSLPASNKQQSDGTTTAPRRMTLLERLAENKTKKLNESLSRMSIANSDNDSDED